MDDRSTRRRQPYATRVWPPPRPEDHEDHEDHEDREDALPPSARVYGTPAAPARHMAPWLSRVLIVVAALAVGAGVIAGLAALVLNRVEARATPPPRAVDNLAGVSYPLPSEWREGVVAPVTAFTSVVSHGGDAVVMARPGESVAVSGLRKATLDLTDLYSRLLLHGDKVSVVDDRAVTVNGRAGHTRSLRAEYRDVVNRPSYLKVTLLTGPGGRSTVVLGVAQPDDPRRRADIDAIMFGVR